MSRKLQIVLEDEVFSQLNELCKGDENVMQDYIIHTLKENLNRNKNNFLSEEKDSLEIYLKNSRSGSRNYGIKGQGW
tara:strand:+ start:1392 stop:1622 length:231 start_codon:yes stop_codon:yes gene_type:complete